MSDIKKLYDEFISYPDIDLHYNEIAASIPDNTIKKQYFQVYVDLFRSLRPRKPTFDEFSKNIGEMETLSSGISSINLKKGGKRRRFRKSKRIRRKKSKRRRTKRRKYF